MQRDFVWVGFSKRSYGHSAYLMRKAKGNTPNVQPEDPSKDRCAVHRKEVIIRNTRNEKARKQQNRKCSLVMQRCALGCCWVNGVCHVHNWAAEGRVVHTFSHRRGSRYALSGIRYRSHAKDWSRASRIGGRSCTYEVLVRLQQLDSQHAHILWKIFSKQTLSKECWFTLNFVECLFRSRITKYVDTSSFWVW